MPLRTTVTTLSTEPMDLPSLCPRQAYSTVLGGGCQIVGAGRSRRAHLADSPRWGRAEICESWARFSLCWVGEGLDNRRAGRGAGARRNVVTHGSGKHARVGRNDRGDQGAVRAG